MTLSTPICEIFSSLLLLMCLRSFMEKLRENHFDQKCFFSMYLRCLSILANWHVLHENTMDICKEVTACFVCLLFEFKYLPTRCRVLGPFKFSSMNPGRKKTFGAHLILYIGSYRTGPVKAMVRTGPVVFCKLLLNGASYDTEVGCIQFLWAEAKKYKF